MEEIITEVECPALTVRYITPDGPKISSAVLVKDGNEQHLVLLDDTGNQLRDHQPIPFPLSEQYKDVIQIINPGALSEEMFESISTDAQTSSSNVSNMQLGNVASEVDQSVPSSHSIPSFNESLPEASGSEWNGTINSNLSEPSSADTFHMATEVSSTDDSLPIIQSAWHAEAPDSTELSTIAVQRSNTADSSGLLENSDYSQNENESSVSSLPLVENIAEDSLEEMSSSQFHMEPETSHAEMVSPEKPTWGIIVSAQSLANDGDADSTIIGEHVKEKSHSDDHITSTTTPSASNEEVSPSINYNDARGITNLATCNSASLIESDVMEIDSDNRSSEVINEKEKNNFLKQSVLISGEKDCLDILNEACKVLTEQSVALAASDSDNAAKLGSCEKELVPEILYTENMSETNLKCNDQSNISSKEITVEEKDDEKVATVSNSRKNQKDSDLSSEASVKPVERLKRPQRLSKLSDQRKETVVEAANQEHENAPLIISNESAEPDNKEHDGSFGKETKQSRRSLRNSDKPMEEKSDKKESCNTPINKKQQIIEKASNAWSKRLEHSSRVKEVNINESLESVAAAGEREYPIRKSGISKSFGDKRNNIENSVKSSSEKNRAAEKSLNSSNSSESKVQTRKSSTNNSNTNQIDKNTNDKDKLAEKDNNESTWEELVAQEIALQGATSLQNTKLQDKFTEFSGVSVFASSSGSRRPVRQARSLPSRYMFGDEFVSSDISSVRKRPRDDKVNESEPAEEEKKVSEKRRKVESNEEVNDNKPEKKNDIEKSDKKASDNKVKKSIGTDKGDKKSSVVDKHDKKTTVSSKLGKKVDKRDHGGEKGKKESFASKPLNTLAKTAGILKRNMEHMKLKPASGKKFSKKPDVLKKVGNNLKSAKIIKKEMARRKLPQRISSNAKNNNSASEKNKKESNENIFDRMQGVNSTSESPASEKSPSTGAKLTLDHSKIVRKPLFSSLQRSVGVKFNMKEMKFTLARAHSAAQPPLEGKWKLDIDQKQDKQSFLKKMIAMRELERKLKAKESIVEQREQKLKQLGEEVDEKRIMLKAQEAKYNQLVTSKEKRMQMLEIKLHRQEHQLSLKEKKLESLEKQLHGMQAKSANSEGPSNLQSSFTEGDASTSTRLHDKTSEDIQFGAEDEQLSADDLGISVLNTSNTDHQSSELVVGEQLNECMDWAERLTMLEKRLRQKEAGLRNLEQTLQEMKMRLDRRQSELSRFEHQLDTKETVLKTAEHQLAISGAELAAHYKILNSREQEMDLPITSAPLVCAGTTLLLGSVDSLTVEELRTQKLEGEDSGNMNSESSDNDNDDDDLAEGLLTREREYTKLRESGDKGGESGDDVPQSQGCDEETWLRIVGKQSNKTASSGHESSAERPAVATTIRKLRRTEETNSQAAEKDVTNGAV